MSDDKRRQMTRLIWRDRLVRWVPTIALLVALACGYVYLQSERLSHTDAIADVAVHTGTVTALVRGAASPSEHLKVHLDDGRDVDVLLGRSMPPQIGETIGIADSRHASGRHTYTLHH